MSRVLGGTEVLFYVCTNRGHLVSPCVHYSNASHPSWLLHSMHCVHSENSITLRPMSRNLRTFAIFCSILNVYIDRFHDHISAVEYVVSSCDVTKHL